MKIEDEIKGRFRNEYHKGMINLTFTANIMNHKFLQFVKKHEISSQQYNVLKIIRGFRKENQINLAFIKERMLDRSSDVSRIVDKLFQQALIVRNEDSADRRNKVLDITEKGLAILSEMDECEKQVDLMLKNLSESEAVELNRLLDKIRD